VTATKAAGSAKKVKEKAMKVHTRRFGNLAVLSVQGRIVRGQTAMLKDAVLNQSDVSMVVIDLARVSTIDARGLGVMLELRAHAESRGIEFRLKNVTKLVRQVLEITRLIAVFEILPEGAAAQVSLPCPSMISFQTATCV
jgi:anti-anti-sigma factor